MENWTKLFGSPADCECEDCKSVFSPAAYLVDILQFLDNCPRNAAGNNPLDLLLGRPRNSTDPIQLAGRRPDIGNLLLTCENTNTRIPYIDLVNEIMEYYVANYHGQLPFPTFPPDKELRHDTGSASSRELIAEPQYTRIDAYSSIYQNGIYPFILPYHQPLDVIRTYLEFLTSGRAELLETFKFYFDQAASAFAPIPVNAIDAENVLLSLKEYEIVTKVDFASVATAPVSPEAYFGNPAPAYTNAAIPVSDLLQRTGLIYTELLDIIKTKLINPGQAALNVLQNLLNQAVPVVDSQTLYNELKGNSWQADVGFVSALTANGITIAKFTQWVNDNFVPFQKVITFYEPGSACDLDQTVLHSILWLYEKPAADTNIDADFLSRLHRFIRLWRKMKWPVHELDTMTGAVGETDITAALIHKLATVKKINAVLKLPLLNLACLWGNIDTYGDQSLYARLFLKNTGKVSSNGVTEKSIFTPGPLNDILIPNTHFLKNNLPEIFAALGISANEYASIVTDSGIDPVNDKISLENLSILYRYKLLADTLGLSIADFCLLKSDCFKVNPFTDVDTAWDFIQKVQKFQSGAGTAFTVPLLHYILSGKSKDVDNIALSRDKLIDTLAALRNSLINIENGDLDPVSKSQSQQTQIISSASSLTGIDIPITSALVNAGAPSLIPVSIKSGLTANYFKDEKFLLVGNTKTDNEIDFDWKLGVPDAAVGADKFSIRWTGWICAPADADYTFFLDIMEADESAALWIGGERILSLNRPEFADTIAGINGQGVYSMKGGKMYPIIVEYVEIAGNAGVHLSWQTPAVPKAIINTQYLFPATETTALSDKIILYHRAAKLITAFDLTVTELNYFITNNSDFDNIDFLPVDIIQWFRLYDYTFLRKTIPGKLLLPIFQLASAEEQAKPGAVASDAIVSAIVSASVAGWNKEYIIFLNGFYSFKAASFKNEIALLKIKKAIDLAIKTKMPLDATGLPAWTAIETDPSKPITGGFDLLHTVAGQIRNAVKGKYNNNWFTIAKQLNDQIRENQKQALIAYLLTLNLTLPLPPAGKPVTNADMLYEYLVIDVQVTSIVETSRLIQTTLAVQAYIDRCLLGLEKDVPAGSINADEWEWLKHYSIAAGLKKLFVFVENYLDPSLRDDKSPFFTDFEAVLKKNDITDENAESAFRDYLYKLNEVRNLEMCGMYNDTDTQILHVFARTNAAPYSYYYRTATNSTRVFNSWTWAPWQPVQLDIKSIDDGANSGVHLIPVVWKKRLFLFWPEFLQKNIARQAGSASFYSMANDKAPDSSGPQKFWEIRLAWSEFAQGKWTPKKISKERISPLYFTDAEKNNISLLLVDPKSFYWTTNSSVIANSLRITLHLRSSLLESVFGLDQLDIGAFLLSDIRDPILTSYDSSVAATVQKAQITFNKFDFINSENLFKNHVALYVYFSPQASLLPRDCIWSWNNDGNKTDENDDIPLLDAAGNPSTVTIQVPSALHYHCRGLHQG